ncbi:MAG: hypothetical protein E7235_07100 [Lachnospiraceae bacterium]|nr:hypothetical protein [Lachnospiraceae bacterium]
MGNEEFPDLYPQTEFISVEEKPGFQGFVQQTLHEETGLYTYASTRQNPDFDEGRINRPFFMSGFYSDLF